MSILLKRMLVVNWHIINAPQIIDFSNTTFITGGNGTGKTTLVDAIQACVYVTPHSFNMSNDIKDRSSKRNLLSYMNAEGRRKGELRTHIICEFVGNDKNPFLLGFSPSCSGTQLNDKIKKRWWKAPGKTLDDISVTYEDDDGKRYVCTAENVIHQAGADGYVYTSVTDAKASFGRILGLSKSAVDNGANFNEIVKTHLQSVAFNTAGASDINNYLKNYVFNGTAVDVSETLDSLHRQNELQMELGSLINKREKVEAIVNAANRVVTLQNEHSIRELAEYLKNKEDAEARMQSSRTRIENAGNEKMLRSAQKETLDHRIDSLKQEARELEKECGILNLEDKIHAQRKKTEASERAERDVAAFEKRASDYSSAHMSGSPFNRDTYSDFRDEKTERKKHLRDECGELIKTKRALTEEQSVIESKNGFAPGDAMRAMTALKQYFRTQDLEAPAFLYSLLDCKNEEWQEAIETYMGNQRFDIVVKAKNYRKAASFLRDQCPFWHNSALVNLENMRDYSAEENTIASVLDSNDNDVLSYIRYKFGRVVLSDNTATESYKEGLSYIDKKFLRYSGKRLMPMNRISHVVIGEEARKKRLEQIRSSLSELTFSLNEKEAEIKNIEHVLNEGKSLFSQIPSEEKIILASMAESERTELHRLEAQRDAITTSDTMSQIHQYESEIKKAEAEKEVLENDIRELFHVIKTETDKLQENEEKAEAMSQKLKGYDLTEATAYLAAFPKISLRKICEEREDYRIQCGKAEERVDILLSEFNKSHPNTSVASCRKELEKLSSSLIPEIKEKLDVVMTETKVKIAEKIISILRKDILNAERFISNMNRTLKTLKFRNCMYYLKPLEPAEGMEEYYHAIRYYKAANENYDINDILSSITTEDQNKLIEFLYERLLEQEEHKTSLDYTDFKTYCKFGLMIKMGDEPAVDMQTKIGAGSGAEVQIPIYLILASAMVKKTKENKYAINETESMRLMCIDEAFGKMDKENKQRMLQLLTEEFGIQLVVASPINNFDDFETAGSIIIMHENRHARIASSFTYKIFKTKLDAGEFDGVRNENIA